MALRETPQTPSTPPRPAAAPSGAASVTVVRTVVTSTGGDAPPTPQTPQPPVAAAAAAPAAVSPGGGATTSGASLADTVKPDTSFQIQIGISTITIDGETVIHDHLRNANYRLNASGTFIWSRITPQITFTDLLAGIRAMHDVVPEATDRMVAEFLTELINLGVLSASTPAPRG
ncbi:MAG: PqqD family protein [Acetobacteraceae bacterium]